MRMNKFLMLGIAGLAFAACSNEEIIDNGNPAEGNGVVAIKIVSPQATTKSAVDGTLENATQAESVTVTGDITVELVAGTGGGKVTLTKQQIEDGTTTVKFWNVNNPTLVKAYMNGAPEDGDYSDVNITTLQAVPASIAAYGEVTPNLTSQKDSPETEEGVVNSGNEDGDEDKQYQMWNATVSLEIAVARLELSGIQHRISGSHEADDCEYSKLTINGVYLDNLKATGDATPSDYQFVENGDGTGAKAILSYEVASADQDFLVAENVWPEAGKAYAFNFFPGTKESENPIIKIYFAEATAAAGQEPKSQPRYAMITKYVSATNGNDATKEEIEAAAGITLEAGKIYRITKAILDDDNILGDEGGNTLYGVTVLVEEATWAVEDIQADWSEGTNE